MYVSVFMGACVCFKEGEREIVCMCVWKGDSMCVCVVEKDVVRERKRERGR